MAGKTVRYTVRLTPDEAKMVNENAKAAGMNESAYIRLMINQKPNDYPEIRILLKSLINEVNHIGVNINQIVKNHNSNFYNESEKERLVAYLRKLIVTVDEAVKSIGNQ